MLQDDGLGRRRGQHHRRDLHRRFRPAQPSGQFRHVLPSLRLAVIAPIVRGACRAGRGRRPPSCQPSRRRGTVDGGDAGTATSTGRPRESARGSHRRRPALLSMPSGAGRWWRRLAERTRRPCPSSRWLRHRRTRCRCPAWRLSASGEPVIQLTPPQSPLSEAQNRHDRPVTRVTASATSAPKAMALLSFPGRHVACTTPMYDIGAASGVPCTTWMSESLDGPMNRSPASSMKSMRPASAAIFSLAVSSWERCSTRADHRMVPAGGDHTVVQAKTSWPETSRTRPATSIGVADRGARSSGVDGASATEEQHLDTPLAPSCNNGFVTVAPINVAVNRRRQIASGLAAGATGGTSAGPPRRTGAATRARPPAAPPRRC